MPPQFPRKGPAEEVADASEPMYPIFAPRCYEGADGYQSAYADGHHTR